MSLTRPTWTALLLTLVAFAVTSPARAQQVNLSTQVSESRVEMGESFVVQLTALVEAGGAVPQSPLLRVPAAVIAHGPSVSSQQQVQIINGRMLQRVGITASWTVTANRVGRLNIGPASIEIGGRRVEDRAVIVEVVPAGQGASRRPPRTRGWPFDPNDPFGGRSIFPDFDFGPGMGPDDQLDRMLPPIPEEYHVDHAKDPVAFLRASVTPARPVVGQQVTLRVYAYGAQGPFNEAGSTEPSKADFLTFNLNGGNDARMYQLAIDNQLWLVAKVREIALFPIRAGTVEVGAMTFHFGGRRYGARGNQSLTRRSEPTTIVVTEPPTQDRPTGYRVGDVGRYELSAEVSPGEIEAGGAVSVVAKLEGTGNVPQKLRLPQRHGIEWAQPTIVEDIRPQDGFIGGWRKFSYVVRVEEAGRIDLGDLEVPYWDPERRAYAVARAMLGGVDVKAGGAAQRSRKQRAERDPLESLLTPRAKLGRHDQGAEAFTDKTWFWPLLLFGPLGIVLVRGGVLLTKRLRTTLAERGRAHETLTQSALREAREAAQAGNAKATASGVERAVFLAIEGATGLRARALLREELPRALELEGGLPSAVAGGVADLLKDCDTARFAGHGDGATPAELLAKATELVRQITRNGRNGKRRPRRPAQDERVAEQAT